VNELRLR
jgi:hypothetical protein